MFGRWRKNTKRERSRALPRARLAGEALEVRQMLATVTGEILINYFVGPQVQTWSLTAGDQSSSYEDAKLYSEKFELFRPTSASVRFDQAMNVATSGDPWQHSALNPMNWQLLKNGQIANELIVGIQPADANARTFRLDFTAALEPGAYSLVARDTLMSDHGVFDTAPQPLNGDRNSEAGGNADFQFVVSTAVAEDPAQQVAWSGSHQVMARDAAGNYVVAWIGEGSVSNSKVYARRFSNQGEPLGETFLAGSASGGSINWIDVAMGDDGQFVVGWRGWSGTVIGWQQLGVGGVARFSAQGQLLGDLEWPGMDIGDMSDIAIGPDGEIYVASERDLIISQIPFENQPEWYRSTIFLTRYDAAGQLLGEPIEVARGRGPQLAITRAAPPNPLSLGPSEVMITWSAGHRGDGGVYAQAFKANLQNVGQPLRVSFLPGSAFSPRIAALDSSSFVISWQDDAGRVYAQRVHGFGGRQGPLISVKDASPLIRHQVTAAEDGSFLVTWDSGTVQARAFNSLGTPISDAAIVAKGNYSYSPPAAISLGNDRWLVSWTGSSGLQNDFNGVPYIWSREITLAEPLVVDLNGISAGSNFENDYVPGGRLVAVGHAGYTAIEGSDEIVSATVIIENYLPGDSLTLADERSDPFEPPPETNIQASIVGGVVTLTGRDTADAYARFLRRIRFSTTAERAVGSKVEFRVVVDDGARQSAAAHSTISIHQPGRSSVVGTYLFYNNSSYDGYDPGAGASDDAAIATDKVAHYFDDSSRPANYTNYVHGINGIMIDIAGEHGEITLDDFHFSVGVFIDEIRFDSAEAPPPLDFVVRPGAGVGGSDRVQIVWADGAIKNAWLRVALIDNGDTGLANAEVFHFGNQVGDIGNLINFDLPGAVNAVDALAVINRLLDPATGARAAAIDDPLDFDRDGRITAKDAMTVINRLLDEHNTPLVMYNPPRMSIGGMESGTTVILHRDGIIEVVDREAGALNAWLAELPEADDDLELSWVAPDAPAPLLLDPDDLRR